MDSSFLGECSLWNSPASPCDAQNWDSDSAKHWTTLSDATLDTYKNDMTRFLVCVLRSVDGHVSGYRIPLTETQSGLVKRFWDLLSKGVDMNDHVHDLFFSLMAPLQNSQDNDQWTCPLTCFLACDSVLLDGRMRTAVQFTGPLAHWKYLIHSTCMYEAKKRQGKYPTLKL